MAAVAILASKVPLSIWFFRHGERLAQRGVVLGTPFFFTTAFYFLFGIYQQEDRRMPPLRNGLSIEPYGIGPFVGPIPSTLFVALRPKLLTLAWQCG